MFTSVYDKMFQYTVLSCIDATESTIITPERLKDGITYDFITDCFQEHSCFLSNILVGVYPVTVRWSRTTTNKTRFRIYNLPIKQQDMFAFEICPDAFFICEFLDVPIVEDILIRHDDERRSLSVSCPSHRLSFASWEHVFGDGADAMKYRKGEMSDSGFLPPNWWEHENFPKKPRNSDISS